MDKATADALDGLLGESSDPGQGESAYAVKGVVRFSMAFLPPALRCLLRSGLLSEQGWARLAWVRAADIN